MSNDRLCLLYENQGRMHKALEEFRLAAVYDPKNSVIHFDVGAIEMRNGRYGEAAIAFQKAVQLNPKWDLAHRNLGLVCLQFFGQKGRRTQTSQEGFESESRDEGRSPAA